MLLATALALRVAVVFVALRHMPIVSDADAYAEQARRLAHGFPGSFAYYWPPGTSYFLAPLSYLVGGGDWVGKAASIAVDVACVALIVLLASRCVRDRRIAFTAGWIYALYPEAVLTAGQPYSFSLTMLCLLLMALALLMASAEGRAAGWVVAGAAFGFAILTRPSTVSVAVALLVVGLAAARVAQRRERLRLLLGSAAFVVCALAIVLPVMRHNARQGQGWTVSTANEQNFWIGNNRLTPDYKTWDLGQHPLSEYPPRVRRVLKRFHVGHPSRADRREMLDDALDYVESHPGVTALRTANRARAFWGFDYTASGDIKTVFGLREIFVAPLVALEAAGYAALMVLAFIGVAVGRGLLRTPRALYLGALIAGYELSYLAAYAAGRWHAPLIGFIAPFSAAGLYASRPWAVQFPLLRSSRLLWALCIVFVLLQFEYAYYVVR